MARTSTTTMSFESAMANASSSAVEVEVVLCLELHEEGEACGGAPWQGLPPMWLGHSPLANMCAPASTRTLYSRGTMVGGRLCAAAQDLRLAPNGLNFGKIRPFQ
jgi:hypothetical protein